MYVVLCIVDNS